MKFTAFASVLIFLGACTNGVVDVSYSNFNNDNVPLPAIAYPCPMQGFILDHDASLVLTTTSPASTTFSISPPLPTGLSMDPTTGTISGMAAVTTTSTPYVVTATLGTQLQSTIISIETGEGFVVNSFNDTPDTSPGDGACAASDGTCTLRAAILELDGEANPGTLILLPAGTITPTTSGTPLTKPASIYGSCTAVPTTIDGGSNVGPLFYSSASNGSLNNLTIQNGHTTSNNGAAINLSGSGSFTLNYVTLVNNNAFGSGNGGALAISNTGTTNINFSKFTSNSTGTSGGGGAIYDLSGNLNIKSSAFNNNSAPAFGGGAIYFVGSSLTIFSSSFNGNTTNSHQGGALELAPQVQATITEATFVNNSAISGGAVAIGNSSSITFSECDFSNNIATSAGGAIYLGADANLLISQSDLYQNQTSGSGGAMYLAAGTATVANSTITANQALAAGGTGGAFNVVNATLKLYNDTVAQNVTTANGGGIYITGGAYLLSNTIFSGNLSSSSLNSCSSAILGTSAGINIFDDDGNCASVANDLNGVTANLGPIQNNGGITLTMIPDAASPAINGGAVTACTASPVNGVNQIGTARTTNSCNIGAY